MPPLTQDDGPYQPAPQCPRRSKLALAFKALGAIAVLLVAGVVYVALQVRSTPPHYQKHLAFIDRTTDAQRQAIAADAIAKFDAVVALASGRQHTDPKQRPTNGNDTPTGQLDTTTVYTVEMSPDELNALITEELDAFLAQSGGSIPEGITHPMIAHDAQQSFVVTFTAQVEDVSQVVSAWFNLQFTRGGDARVRVTRFDAGRMPIPASRIGEAIADRASQDQAQRVGRFLADLENYTFSPVLSAGDGHSLQVLDFRAVNAGFAFDVRVLDDNADKPQLAKAKPRH